MTNIVIASFANEAQAIDAIHKLTELESFGDLTVYEMVMLRKNASGVVEKIKRESNDGLGTLKGMAVGTLIGAIAGPVGMLVGMLTGTLTGAAVESDYYSFSSDFGTKFADKMTPDTVAIIAEVDEISSVFIDNALLPLGAIITRSDVDYEYEKYQNDQIEAYEKEVEAERIKLKTAQSDEKIRIQNHIYDLKEKRRNRLAEMENKVDAFKAGVNADFKDFKVSRLEHKIERYQAKLIELQDELNRAKAA